MNEFIDIVKTYGPGGGLIGLVSLAVYLIYTGRLVPRATVNMLITRADTETATWKAATEKSEAARKEQAAQFAELLEQTKITNQLLQGLPKRQPTQPGGR